jgi:hypothetical protein
MCIRIQYVVLIYLDIYGEPSAHSIFCKLRAQKQQDEERIALQDKVMDAEHHFRAMCAEVTDPNAEAFWRRIKNACTEFISFSTFNFSLCKCV